MGHGGRARRLALLVAGVGLAVALAPGGGAAAAARGDEPEPLLPPAEEGDVQIAPVDRPAARAGDTVPAGPREPASARGDNPRDLDLGDLAGPWGLLALAAVGLTVVGATRLRRMVHLWLSTEALRQSGFGTPADEPTTTFSLLVPARREDPVLGRALDRLAELDHPSFEVLVVVGHDDPATHDIAIAAAARHPDRIRVIAERSFDESASTALNTALEVCRGEVIGVFEAGDKVHPQLLRHVDACLAATRADVLQGGVQILDLGTRWFGIRNVVERYFWFRSRLHFHAHQGFTPVDASTVFLRAGVVRAAGGWDAGCVAENSELGVRLSVDGVTTAVAYEPELATRKLCPETTRDLLRQQTRSIQGYLQVARAGVWRRLPERRQRLLARATLLRPLVEALTGVTVAAVVAAALLGGAPPIVTALALVAAVPLVMTVVVEVAGLAELSRTHGSGIGWRDHLRLVWSAGPYWLVSAAAAVGALVAYRRRPAHAAGADPDDLGGTVVGRGVIDLAGGETGAGVAADARALAAGHPLPPAGASPVGGSPSAAGTSPAGVPAAGAPAAGAPPWPAGWSDPPPAAPTWPTGWGERSDDVDDDHDDGHGDDDPCDHGDDGGDDGRGDDGRGDDHGDDTGGGDGGIESGGGGGAPTWPTGWTQDATADPVPVGRQERAAGRGGGTSTVGPGVVPMGGRTPVWSDAPAVSRSVPDR
jgi:hypothetical protein